MKNRDQLYSDIADAFKIQLGDLPSDFSEQTDLYDELGIDSLDMLAAAQRLQNKYRVSLDNENIASLRTIGDVVSFVEKRVAYAEKTAH